MEVLKKILIHRIKKNCDNFFYIRTYENIDRQLRDSNRHHIQDTGPPRPTESRGELKCVLSFSFPLIWLTHTLIIYNRLLSRDNLFKISWTWSLWHTGRCTDTVLSSGPSSAWPVSSPSQSPRGRGGSRKCRMRGGSWWSCRLLWMFLFYPRPRCSEQGWGDWTCSCPWRWRWCWGGCWCFLIENYLRGIMSI